MTLDLTAIEAREKAATTGPWNAEEWLARPRVLAGDGKILIGYEGSRSNADFIAAARSDIPALIAEVRKLREALKKVEWADQDCCPDCGAVGLNASDESKHWDSCLLGKALT